MPDTGGTGNKPKFGASIILSAVSFAACKAEEEKETTEEEMVGWHHQLNGHEFEQTQGDSKGQGSLACCSPWGCRVRQDLVIEQKDCNCYAVN